MLFLYKSFTRSTRQSRFCRTEGPSIQHCWTQFTRHKTLGSHFPYDVYISRGIVYCTFNCMTNMDDLQAQPSRLTTNTSLVVHLKPHSKQKIRPEITHLINMRIILTSAKNDVNKVYILGEKLTSHMHIPSYYLHGPHLIIFDTVENSISII